MGCSLGDAALTRIHKVCLRSFSYSALTLNYFNILCLINYHKVLGEA